MNKQASQNVKYSQDCPIPFSLNINSKTDTRKCLKCILKQFSSTSTCTP